MNRRFRCLLLTAPLAATLPAASACKGDDHGSIYGDDTGGDGDGDGDGTGDGDGDGDGTGNGDGDGDGDGDGVNYDVGNGDGDGDGDGSDSCDAAANQPSNVGCEFWAVDMDQVDAFNDPASEPWGVAISNAGAEQADILIEMNQAAPGEPLSLVTVVDESIPVDALSTFLLPTRELDCGVAPNDYASPGTCLSSRAFRIRSSSPIVVYQFNVFENAYSNDASLLLPTNALGNVYRVLGWIAGHPVDPFNFGILDRSAVTIVGTEENTTVTVRPSFRIKGNPPIPATAAGDEIVVELGPFDVLNLETDDGTMQDDMETIADLSGTTVTSNRPVAVFSGVESTAAPGGVVDIPTYPGWESDDTCCLDHLEEQMFPVESIGMKYVVTRSPIRSTSGVYVEPDVIRFLGVAESATVTTSLPAPFDSFTLAPGEIRTTWADEDFVATSDHPFMVSQLLISQSYVDGPYTGDPSLTVFPPVEQHRADYRILTPGSWTTNHVVLATEPDNEITIDGAVPGNCVITSAGDLDGVAYESRRCPLDEGVHTLAGEKAFGVTAYGYGGAGSYAFAGGADVEQIYDPPG